MYFIHFYTFTKCLKIHSLVIKINIFKIVQKGDKNVYIKFQTEITVMYYVVHVCFDNMYLIKYSAIYLIKNSTPFKFKKLT